MEITVTNIKILSNSEYSPDTPALYCATLEFSETDTYYFREAKITVRFDADENATVKKIQEIAFAKAKDFLQENLLKF